MGLCPLHHGVGVVHVPFAPALRYSPSGDPDFPSDTAKAAHAYLLGLCGLLPPSPAAFPGVRSLLVCWLPLAFFPLRPCFGWSALPALLFVVLVGAGGSLSFVGLVCFAGVACFLFGLFVWCFFVLSVWLVFRFRVVLLLFPPLSFFSGPFVCFAPTCATKVLVYHCTCVSDRRLDRFTCTVYLHRVTMFLLQCSCVTICRVLR